MESEKEIRAKLKAIGELKIRNQFYSKVDSSYREKSLEFQDKWKDLTPEERKKDIKGQEIYKSLNAPLTAICLGNTIESAEKSFKEGLRLIKQVEKEIDSWLQKEIPEKKEKLDEIKQVLKDYPRPAIMDSELTPLLPLLAQSVLKMEREGESLIYRKDWQDGYSLIEYRIPKTVKTEDIEKYFAKCRIPIYLITKQNAFAQRTLSPIIPISEFEPLGENAIREIETHYDSLSYIRYEYRRYGKGMKYRYGFELKPIIRKFVKIGKGKNSYVKGALDYEADKALTAFINADRKLIGREKDAESLICEDIKRIYELRQEGGIDNISYREIPAGFISVWEKRAVKASYMIWDRFSPLFANKSKTYPIQFKTILQDYLEINKTEIRTKSTAFLTKELEITLNILKNITGIDWGVGEETLKFFDNPFMRFSEEDIKKSGWSLVIGKIQRLKKEFKDIENFPILTKEKFLDFSIFFIRPIKDSKDAWELPSSIQKPGALSFPIIP
jgi:hypothetical protein